VPIIGGKDLDLHQLYKEVTSRGGIDKVRNEYNAVESNFLNKVVYLVRLFNSIVHVVQLH
jgi:hypothetical protein